MSRQTINIVGGATRERAEQARVVFTTGNHCELYEDLTEFLHRLPKDGVVLSIDEQIHGGVAKVIQSLSAKGKWYPVIGASFNPKPAEVVKAIKAGAVDYLSLPLTSAKIENMLSQIGVEINAYEQAKRKMAEARSRIRILTAREREVLDWLAEGFSNKDIARQLSISPRTVEVHRASMMSKLGADHPSHAVRLHMEALWEINPSVTDA